MPGTIRGDPVHCAKSTKTVTAATRIFSEQRTLRYMASMRGRRLIQAAALAGALPFLAGSIDRGAAFDERVLAAHNRERTAMGVRALDWDVKLAADAKSWADHLARTNGFEHSPSDPSDMDAPGENLWAGTVGRYSPEEMVQLWIDEKADFKPGVFPYISRSENLEAVGHYTQLIWKQTARVGCALASGAKEDILVCRYSLAGNVIGERPI